MLTDLKNIEVAVQNIDTIVTDYESRLDAQSLEIHDKDTLIQELQSQIKDTKTAPSGFTRILTFLNKRPDWIQPANAGDTGGPDPSKVGGVFTVTPGEAATFSAKGNYPYNNGYWYIKTKGLSSNHLIMMFDVFFPTSGDIAACQAIEFELQQSLDGFIYNMAWQCPVKSSGFWRTFDKTNRRWEATSIPSTKFTAGTWVTIVAEYSLDLTNHTVTHQSLTVSDRQYVVNITRPAQLKTESNYLSAAYQMDSDGKTPPTPYVTKVQAMHVIY